MYFKPSYLPHNDVAYDLVSSLAETLGLRLNKKIEIILASYLATAKKAKGKAFDWWTGNDNKKLKFWSLFDHVSNQSVREVYKLLKEHEYIGASANIPDTTIERMGFGLPNWVVAKHLPNQTLEEATFIEANLPYVLVNKKEEYEEKLARRKHKRAAPKLGIKHVKKKFGRAYSLAYRPVKKMNAYWADHPLHNPITNEYYSSARRIFHNGSIKSGGRWYGGWMEYSSNQRFAFTIDNHPIVQVDVNAMILSLLSALTGKPMNVGGVYQDAYQAVVCQIPTITNARKKVKQVIMELTGTGNSSKSKPSPDSKILEEEFTYIRDLCLQAYPALECLDNKRFNFPNDLSFHESNILTQTLLSLKQQGVVAYPVHDCVIVKQGREDDAVDTFRRVFKEYVKTDFDIALSVESNPSNKVRIEGRHPIVIL